MTIWYVDPEGGNDANDGKSFANRVKSLNAFTTAAGDQVRLIASPAPNSVGNATWTNNNGSVTLAAAVTQTIDNLQATTGWVAGANVTVSTSTTWRRYGSTQVQFTMSSSFVAGALIAYKPFSALDLSAFACLSALCGWSTTSQAAAGISIALCSDSVGQVPIVSLPMDSFNFGNNAAATSSLFENGGSALPSGINSIAIYSTGSTRPFSTSGALYLANLIACKAVHAANHLSHNSVIGKMTAGEPEWYSIQYIDGTTVNLGAQPDYARASGSRVYYGTTETVATYAMVGIRPRYNSTTYTIKAANGTQANPITWTGGWDRTSMSSQTGQTWLNGQRIANNLWANPQSLASQCQWHIFPDSTVGAMCMNGTSPIFTNGQYGRVFRWAGIVDCGLFFTSYTASTGNYGAAEYSLDFAVFCGQGVVLQYELGCFIKVRVRRITGAVSNGVSSYQVLDDRQSDIWVGQIDSSAYGISTNSSGAFTSSIKVRGTTFANNQYDLSTASSSQIEVERPTFVSGTPQINNLSGGLACAVRLTAVGGARWDNRIYRGPLTQTVDQSTVHGSTAQSVKVNVLDYTHLGIVPYRTRLMRVAALAGKTIVATCWVQRSDSTNLSASIGVLQGPVAGVAEASVAASGASGAWEQLTITVNPTEDGVIDIYGYVGVPTASASANGQSVWFGDMGVSSS